MITQEIPISLLMDPQKMLIFRKGDYGNQIKINFPDLTGITSAEFRLIKPDNTFVVSTGEIIENDIIITITQQMSILSGYAIFNLRLINSQSNIYTYVGRALIDDNINLDDYAASVAVVNGYTFPDDFLTSADLSQYATKTYVNEAIAEVPTYIPPNYSTTEQDTGLKWIDGKKIYQKSIVRTNEIYGSDRTLDSGVADMDILIHQHWVITGEMNVTPAVTQSGTYIRVKHVGGGILKTGDSQVYFAASTQRTWILTIYYTKTTDTV